MKKTSLVTVQGKKMMSYAELVVLTDSQHKKLTLYAMGKRLAGLEELRKRIDNLAKDLQINWSIEDNGNIHIVCIERTTTAPIDDAKYHDLEIAATNFMSAIDKIEVPESEPECPSHDNADEEEMTGKQFIEKLLHDLELPKEDADHVIGAQILCMGPKSLPFPLPWGKLGYYTLKEMCELYLAAHEND